MSGDAERLFQGEIRVHIRHDVALLNQFHQPSSIRRRGLTENNVVARLCAGEIRLDHGGATRSIGAVGNREHLVDATVA